MVNNQSTLSKQFKSPAQKRRKVERHQENQRLRAELHAEKSAYSCMQKRVELQRKIDAISERG